MSRLSTLATHLHLLEQTLRSSPLGGLQVSVAPPATPDAMARAIVDLDAHAQQLFNERQRVKENAEVARSVLSAS